MTCFAVITEIDGENNACCKILIDPEGEKNLVGSNIIVDPQNIDREEFVKLFGDALKNEDQKMIDLSKRQLVMGNAPVFKLGEIMILDTSGRTIPDGRKPRKWFVTYEVFSDIEAAIKKSKEVYEGGMR